MESRLCQLKKALIYAIINQGTNQVDMRINPGIFQKYDIRGRFPQELNERTVYLVARTFGLLFKDKKRIAVGRDARPSSVSLQEAVIKGLEETGKEVIDVGMASTPAFYFSVVHFKCDGGIFVTASHLSEKFNGMKIVGRDAVPIGKEEGLGEIEEMIKQGEIHFRKQQGKVVEKDISSSYVEEVKSKAGSFSGEKIVMDAGNGMTGLYLQKIFKDLELNIVPLLWEVDCSFPNHGADPKEPRNRETASKKVDEEKAGLGFLWDGDGDRFYALDSRGEVIDPSFISLIIGRYLISKSEHKKIVVDIRTSGVVEDKIKEAGGEVIRSKTWHPEVKKKMREENAVFGSETSGHYVFQDFYYLDDGLLAALYFLEAVKKLEKPLEQYLEELRKEYFILPETNFEVESEKEVQNILSRLEDFYKEQASRIEKIDGLSVYFSDWRFNLRPSQSEPLLRLNMEAKTEKVLQSKKKEIDSLVKGS